MTGEMGNSRNSLLEEHHESVAEHKKINAMDDISE